MKSAIAKAFLLAAFAPILLLASCAPPDAWVSARERIAAEAAKHYEVSLGFAGDICFADNYVPMEHLAEIGSTNIADGIDQRFIDLMRSMDLMWINNEFCYSDRGEPLEGKMYTFRGSPSHVTYLDELGIDIAGLANNHVFDYGEEAFLDTLATLEGDNMPYVGAGRNIDEAKAPVYLKANGLTIAYIAASCAEYTVYTPEATATSPGILLCYDDTLVINAIREARVNADYVVVLPHWGVEHSTELESSQIDSAHAYIDAGADAVIGGHAHNLQGLEYYNGKPIFYNLGNFWFDDYDVVDTAVAEIRITGTCDDKGMRLPESEEVKLVIHPGMQSEVFTSWADTPEWRSDAFRRLEDISINVTIGDDGVVHGQ